jgi:hypothetical protein
MSYRIPDALIAEENAKLAAALERRLERAGADIEAVTAKVAGFAVAVPTWGSVRGHALCALSGPRRAARNLRQARGLRDDPSAHARTPDLLAAFPVGQGRGLSGARRTGGRARPRFRRGQFQHPSGRNRPETFL